MSDIQFFMPMIPPTITAQQHKVAFLNGKPVFYDPPELKAAKAKLEAHLAQHRPKKPLEGPLTLSVIWIFPTGGKHKDGEPKITKPDTDNLQKALKDILQKLGFFKDDMQIYFENCMKLYGDTPGIDIAILMDDSDGR